jgi:hypothetical protein
MLVSELIRKLENINRPDSEVVIDSRSCGYDFDEVTGIKSADVVTILGQKEV